MSSHDGDTVRRVARPDKAALGKRLARIEGQVKAVRDMIADDRYCVEVITQIQAARSALGAVAELLLDGHLKACVARAMKKDGGEAEVEEVIALLKKYR